MSLPILSSNYLATFDGGGVQINNFHKFEHHHHPLSEQLFLENIKIS
jgi:hypothetical protein